MRSADHPQNNPIVTKTILQSAIKIDSPNTRLWLANYIDKLISTLPHFRAHITFTINHGTTISSNEDPNNFARYNIITNNVLIKSSLLHPDIRNNSHIFLMPSLLHEFTHAHHYTMLRAAGRLPFLQLGLSAIKSAIATIDLAHCLSSESAEITFPHLQSNPNTKYDHHRNPFSSGLFPGYTTAPHMQYSSKHIHVIVQYFKYATALAGQPLNAPGLPYISDNYKILPILAFLLPEGLTLSTFDPRLISMISESINVTHTSKELFEKFLMPDIFHDHHNPKQLAVWKKLSVEQSGTLNRLLQLAEIMSQTTSVNQLKTCLKQTLSEIEQLTNPHLAAIETISTSCERFLAEALAASHEHEHLGSLLNDTQISQICTFRDTPQHDTNTSAFLHTATQTSQQHDSSCALVPTETTTATIESLTTSAYCFSFGFLQQFLNRSINIGLQDSSAIIRWLTQLLAQACLFYACGYSSEETLIMMATYTAIDIISSAQPQLAGITTTAVFCSQTRSPQSLLTTSVNLFTSVAGSETGKRAANALANLCGYQQPAQPI